MYSLYDSISIKKRISPFITRLFGTLQNSNRAYYLLILCFLLCERLFAQPFGNEWIDYNQRYLKIKVVNDAVYRIDSATLANGVALTGGSLSAIDPRNFQLFRLGVEQPIWIEGESDGQFNNSDFIEFYGERNRGEADAGLYGGIAQQLNPYYSLFSDTAIYFLTWNNAINNLRYSFYQDTAFSFYTPSPYFLSKEIYAGSIYMQGATDGVGVTDPQYIPTEGFYGPEFYFGQSTTLPLTSSSAFASGPAARLRVRVGSHSDDYAISNENTIRIQYNSTLYDTTYDGYAVYTYDQFFPAADLNAAQLQVSVASLNNSSAGSSGRTAVAFADLTYPHTWNMDSRTRYAGLLPDNTLQGSSLLNMVNMGGAGAVYVYDRFGNRRIPTIFGPQGFQAVVPNGNGSDKPFVVFIESGIQNITSLTPAGANGAFTNYGANLGDSSFVIVTHRKLWNVAQDYQTYRASIAGGSHHVTLANVEELYDQFAFGIHHHANSIRNFSDYLIQNSPSAPRHLFLFGKSYYTYLSRSQPYYSMCLVPTYGYPSTDVGFTAGLNGTNWEPAIATGRLAAKDSTEARWYLDKVIEYENNAPAEWMKHVLHFGGGTSTAEQNTFKYYLQTYEATIEDTAFGGVVQTYLKTSSNPIQINSSDTLRRRIEDGVSIMTFFGHASGTGFDQSIDDPSTYNNFDRYPLLIANSCYAGDLHSTGNSSSEAFTLIENKGTIGYIASVGLGIAGFLDAYTSRLYKAIGQIEYGNSIGACMQRAAFDAQNSNPSSLFMKATIMEMTLHGDPAVKINSFKQPDYVITNADVSFDQETYPDSIIVHNVVSNVGKAVNDTIVVRLQRRLPNGDTATYFQQVRAPYYRDTVSFVVPVDVQNGIGLNRFNIYVDFYGQVAELNETNNYTIPDVDLLIKGSAIAPIYPYPYAVIPTDTVTLKASTINVFEPQRTYRFELDTTDLFNSPFKQTYVINAPGGVVTWRPNLLATDSSVYFWRVSPDSITPTDAFVWRESSFQYINGQTGWGQDHIFQFKNDAYQYVKLNRPQRRFDFVNDVKTISVKNGIYGPTVPWNEVWYKMNGATQHIFTCAPPGVSIAVIDPVSGNPWSFNVNTPSVHPVYGNYACVANQSLQAFDYFDNDSGWRASIESFINQIPTGHYVLVYSQWLHSASQYNTGLRNALQSIGSGMVGTGNISDTTAFIIWGRKGDAAGTADEVIGQNIQSVITFQDTIVTNWREGYIASEIVGPASAWGSLHWKQVDDETPSNDSVALEIWGIDIQGNKTMIQRLPEDSTDILNLGNLVNVNSYPRLQLILRTIDDTNRTPAQLQRWHVLYTPLPDAALDPPLEFSLYNDTIQEGDSIKLRMAVRNVTEWAFSDSLLITYWVKDRNGNIRYLPQQLTAPPFAGFSNFTATLNFSTEGFPGLNELWMEVNPIGNVNSQAEQHHFNNIAMMPFYVGTDRINPLLDVTFDGMHIMNGDIVSARPQILITLKDENQFLALNDTADFRVFIRRPNQSNLELLPWNSELQFTPAILPNNSCKILYTPTLQTDGIYELLVQAKDRSSNNSGLVDYRITFEVINKATITNVINYPNPFTTSTQFVFTLTGSEVPQVFTIQIMTISGKVIREISREELGDIRIGRNITTYAWDGTDQFGDRLANGVYLYRVITRLNGNAIEQRESGADSYIIQGWGKMYLMR